MLRLNTRDPGFDKAFRRLVRDRRESDENVARDVQIILDDVRNRGDAALAELTLKFDGHALTDEADWRVSAEACREAFDALEPGLRAALELAAQRIRTYHEAQRPADRDMVDETGVRLGAVWRAVDAAGLYVPGGRAAYPSSLLMNAIPAKVAGVGRLVVVTPTPKGQVNPLVLAAAHLAGEDRCHQVQHEESGCEQRDGRTQVGHAGAHLGMAAGIHDAYVDEAFAAVVEEFAEGVLEFRVAALGHEAGRDDVEDRRVLGDQGFQAGTGGFVHEPRAVGEQQGEHHHLDDGARQQESDADREVAQHGQVQGLDRVSRSIRAPRNGWGGLAGQGPTYIGSRAGSLNVALHGDARRNAGVAVSITDYPLFMRPVSRCRVALPCD